MTRLSLEQVIDRVQDVPALPQIVNRVIELTEDPNSTARDIEAVINKDQSLTARVLRLANSAYYGYPRRISTITEATILLGFQTVKSITISAAVKKVLFKKLPGYGMPEGALWKHSQTCAIIARCLGKKFSVRNIDEIYTAALLHDIGKVIMSYYMEENYDQVIKMVQQNNMPFIEAEQQILGFDHCQLGAKLCEKWNLPYALMEPIAYHHDPQRGVKNIDSLYITHISDAITMTLGIGLGVDGMAYELYTPALERFGISEEEGIEKIILEISDMISDEQSYDGYQL
ncbi:MAG: HDOD domain-containing protein [Xylanivirga thermophila]|uniref:HDOD domain-containing protein n=1 Tax=Xylanivirga thermophila TaxID=2496273 RepID=UPI0039F561A9